MTDSYEKHNKEVSELWDNYQKGCNERVPITISFDEQFLLPLWGRTFGQYYRDVRTQIDVQLKSQKWIRENIPQDAEMGLPEVWNVTPPRYSCSEENEFLGAEMIIQENDYAWGKPISLSKTELLKHLQSIDVIERIKECTLFRQYAEMKTYTTDMDFCGRPVKTSLPVSSTHGIFTKAAEIRGLTQICLDLYEDPKFAKELLETVTELFIARIKSWHELLDSDRTFPGDEAWGLADDSVTMLSKEHYEEFVLPCHQKIYFQMTTGTRRIHLCGQVQHLFKILHKELGITIFNGPGPQIDLLQMLNEINAPIEIQAEVAHATLQRSHAEIEKEVQALLKEEVKERTKISLTGYVPKETPLDNLTYFYECGKKHGKVSR